MQFCNFYNFILTQQPQGLYHYFLISNTELHYRNGVNKTVCMPPCNYAYTKQFLSPYISFEKNFEFYMPSLIMFILPNKSKHCLVIHLDLGWKEKDLGMLNVNFQLYTSLISI